MLECKNGERTSYEETFAGSLFHGNPRVRSRANGQDHGGYCHAGVARRCPATVCCPTTRGTDELHDGDDPKECAGVDPPIDAWRRLSEDDAAAEEGVR